MTIKRLKGTNKKTGHCKLSVEGNMTIYEAEALRNELVEYQNTYSDLQLNLSAVADFDSSGVQLLMVLENSAKNLGKAFCVDHISDPVAEVLKLYQLDQQYSCNAGANS